MLGPACGDGAGKGVAVTATGDPAGELDPERVGSLGFEVAPAPGHHPMSPVWGRQLAFRDLEGLGVFLVGSGPVLAPARPLPALEVSCLLGVAPMAQRPQIRRV